MCHNISQMHCGRTLGRTPFVLGSFRRSCSLVDAMLTIFMVSRDLKLFILLWSNSSDQKHALFRDVLWMKMRNHFQCSHVPQSNNIAYFWASAWKTNSDLRVESFTVWENDGFSPINSGNAHVMADAKVVSQESYFCFIIYDHNLTHWRISHHLETAHCVTCTSYNWCICLCWSILNILAWNRTWYWSSLLLVIVMCKTRLCSVRPLNILHGLTDWP